MPFLNFSGIAFLISSNNINLHGITSGELANAKIMYSLLQYSFYYTLALSSHSCDCDQNLQFEIAKHVAALISCYCCIIVGAIIVLGLGVLFLLSVLLFP